MTTKTISWNTGSGAITLTYQGQGNGTITVTSDANDIGSARSQVIEVQTLDGAITRELTVNQVACPFPVGDVKNYSYTGTYQEVELPAGQYKFQVWGAQGGTCSDGYSGGKGGYSEGVITLSSKTTVRVYVGGQGGSNSGGFNGGGSSTGASSYNNGNISGRSSMGGGGGATDIRLSDGALLSRMIVAGGGSGGAYCYREVTSQGSNQYTSHVISVDLESGYYVGRSTFTQYFYADRTYTVSTDNGTISSVKLGSTEVGTSFTPSSSGTKTLTVTVRYRSGDGSLRRFAGIGSFSDFASGNMYMDTNMSVMYYKDSNYSAYEIFPNRSPYLPSDAPNVYAQCYFFNESNDLIYLWDGSSFYVAEHTSTLTEYYSTSTKDSDYQSGYAGGGTNGAGYSSSYYGKQNAAGDNGSFGQGANQSISGYRYCSGAGGGGWYGGGGGQYSDNSMSYVHYSGGGSGWVNIASAAGNRPSGYTGLELDSGTLYAGNQSFPAPGGDNETGHSGNGYARITRLS